MNNRLLLSSVLSLPALALLLPPVPQDTAVPQETMVGVPVGTVLAWWGEPDQIPAGFEVCDGKPPAARDALFKFRKPDLRGQFLRGSETPQAFNPRAYTSSGEDEVSLELPDMLLTASQLPPHSHPMAHVHAIGNHVHTLANDLTLAAKDPAADAHTHLLPTHDHIIADHVHPLAGEWVQGTLVAPEKGDPFFLKQGGASNALSGPAKLASDTSLPLAATNGLDGDAPQTGKGEGTVATAGLASGAGAADTGAINGSANTGANAGPQQPLDLGDVTFDNRPSYFDVLYIIRIK